MDPTSTLLRFTALTERGTFQHRASGRWTPAERAEEVETHRALFCASLYRSGISRIQVRCVVLVELPLFGWREVEA